MLGCAENEVLKMKNKFLFALIGFILGSLFIGGLFYGFITYQKTKLPQRPVITAKNEITFEEAIEQIKDRKINYVHIKDENAYFYRSGMILYSNKLTEAQFKEVYERVSDSGLTLNIEPNSAYYLLDIDIFPILFLLFLISPPIIVILLIVIIVKMNKQKSLD